MLNNSSKQIVPPVFEIGAELLSIAGHTQPKAIRHSYAAYRDRVRRATQPWKHTVCLDHTFLDISTILQICLQIRPFLTFSLTKFRNPNYEGVMDRVLSRLLISVAHLYLSYKHGNISSHRYILQT